MLILNPLKAASKYIFNQLTYKYNLAATLRSYSAVNMDLNNAFNTALQKDSKIAKLLLSSGKLDLNHKDSEGNSVLSSIVTSKNTSLLKKYFSKVEEAGVQLENSSISGTFNIALNLNDKEVVKVFLKGLTKLNNLEQLQTQSLNHTSPDKAAELPIAPPAYSEINDSLYPIIGDALYVN